MTDIDIYIILIHQAFETFLLKLNMFYLLIFEDYISNPIGTRFLAGILFLKRCERLKVGCSIQM